MLRDLRIVLVEHMDEVLGEALSLERPGQFLRDGDRVIDEIFEGRVTLEAPVPPPAGVN